MVELFANSGDPDQMPHSAAFDLGLHCLPVTLLGVSPDYNGLSTHFPTRNPGRKPWRSYYISKDQRKC